MANGSKNTIYIDLIEPKFDPTHEVSRAMVEYNKFIESYIEELKKCKGVDRVGTTVFNRKVWASKKGHYLLQQDHYLFSNLSSKFPLKENDYELFKSLLHSIDPSITDCAAEECNESSYKKTKTKDAFFGIHSSDWKTYIEKLKEIYPDISGNIFDPIIKSIKSLTESKFIEAFKGKDEKAKQEVTEAVRDILRNMIKLLRMPVSGGFPGTLSEVLSNETDRNASPIVYIAFQPNQEVEGKEENKKAAMIGYYSLRNGEIVETNRCHTRPQRGMFEIIEGYPNSANTTEQNADSNNEDEIIFKILTKLLQLFVEGVPFDDLTHTIFLSVPIYKSYYPGRKKVSGKIAGFLQGWVFIPIDIKAKGMSNEKDIESFIKSLKGGGLLKDLIEGCLIAGNVLVETVRSTGARRAVGRANVDDDDIFALSNSVHHMTGWKIEIPEEKVLSKVENIHKHMLWVDGHPRVLLGNRNNNGDYEVITNGTEDEYKNMTEIILTKTDNSFVEPSDKEIYLFDLAQRLRTVHALILNKQDAKAGGTDEQASIFAHQTKGDIFQLTCDSKNLSRESNFSLWMLNALVERVWGSRGLGEDRPLRESNIELWQGLSNDDTINIVINQAYRSAQRRAMENIPYKSPRWEHDCRTKAMDLSLEQFIECIGLNICSDKVPEWMVYEGFSLIFYHCLWPAMFHAYKASQRMGTLAIPYMKLDWTDVVDCLSVTIRNAPDGNEGNLRPKDMKFLDLAQRKLKGVYRVEMCAGNETDEWWQTRIEVRKYHA